MCLMKVSFISKLFKKFLSPFLNVLIIKKEIVDFKKAGKTIIHYYYFLGVYMFMCVKNGIAMIPNNRTA